MRQADNKLTQTRTKDVENKIIPNVPRGQNRRGVTRPGQKDWRVNPRSYDFIGAIFDPLTPLQTLERAKWMTINHGFRFIVTPNVDHLVRVAKEPEVFNPLYQASWLKRFMDLIKSIITSRLLASATNLMKSLKRRSSLPKIQPDMSLSVLAVRNRKWLQRPVWTAAIASDLGFALGRRLISYQAERNARQNGCKISAWNGSFAWPASRNGCGSATSSKDQKSSGFGRNGHSPTKIRPRLRKNEIADYGGAPLRSRPLPAT